MSKEIERKWLIKSNFSYKDLIKTIEKYVEDKSDVIEDYYINPNTRLRIKNGNPFLTIKDIGFLERDEYEFPLTQEQINVFKDIQENQFLKKTRYYCNYKKQRFEYNVFWDLKQGRQPLIIVELEIDNIDKKIDLPEHIGEEITFNSQYYGYKLFEKLMQKNMSN